MPRSRRGTDSAGVALLVRRLIVWLWIRVEKFVAWNAWRYISTVEDAVGLGGVVDLLARTEGEAAVRLLRAKGAVIGEKARILRGLTLYNVDTDFSHLRIGDRVHIGRDVFLDLAAPITIGDRVTISMRCTLLTHMDPGDSTSASALRACKREGITLGNDAYVGAGSTILAGVIIGCRALVGAGAVVVHRVQDDATVGGVPAVDLPAKVSSRDHA